MSGRSRVALAGGIALGAIVVAVMLWRELHIEREQAAALRVQVAASDAAGDLQPEQGGMGDPQPPALLHQAADTGVAAPALAPPGVALVGDHVNGQGSPADPVSTHARLAHLRAGMERSYPGLVEELRLTDLEADRLFCLLAEAQLMLETEASIFERQPLDLREAAQASRNRQARQRQHDDALRALLGSARHAQWQAYQHNQSAWLQASVYAAALSTAGAALDGAQTKTIVMAMIEEQERRRQDIRALAQTVDASHPHTQQQAREPLNRRQAAGSQRVLEAVSPYLDAQQLRVLGQLMAQQDAVESAAASRRGEAAAGQ